jgi:hypothetical protein
MIIIKEDVRNFSLAKVAARAGDDRYFNLPEGEHYKLLAYISDKLPEGKIIGDIGTYKGFSALALSYNEKVFVFSFDVESNVAPGVRSMPNVEYRLGPVNNYLDALVGCEIIFIDINHTGVDEKIIYDDLLAKGYAGYILFDDIHLNESMETFWKNIEEPKADITDIGHFSGTGIVAIKRKLEIFDTKADLKSKRIRKVSPPLVTPTEENIQLPLVRKEIEE